MTVAYASSASAGIIHARDDGIHSLKNEVQASTDRNNACTDPTVNAIHYMLQERCNAQVDGHKAVKLLNNNYQTECQEELLIPDQYSAFRDKLTRMLKQFERMWNAPLR